MLELRFTIPGQIPRSVQLDQHRVMIGTLLSNHAVLRAPGVDPIHAMIEENAEGHWLLTDLGSATGVKINGITVDVETKISVGDKLTIGSVVVEVGEAVETAAPIPPVPGAAKSPPPPPAAPGAVTEKTVNHANTARVEDSAQVTSQKQTTPPTATVRQEARPAAIERRRAEAEQKDVLFSPRDARPTGDVLEVVAYWGDTVLDVELFHPSMKGFDHVSIGDPTRAHLISAGPDDISRHVLSTVSESGYKLKLLPGMKTRLRRAGKVEKIDGQGSVSLDRRDIAHIKYGAVRYFMLFVRPPSLVLPRSGPKDPFFAMLLTVSMVFYVLAGLGILFMKPPIKKDEKDDPWSIVHIPEKIKPPEPIKKPEIKPEMKIAEKKIPPPVPKPPPPKPPPPKAAKPVEKEKVEQPKPVDKPVPEKRPTEVLTQTANKVPTPPAQKPTEKTADKPAANPLDKLDKASNGMPSTGAKKPDFKLAGPANNKPLGAAGGPLGQGMNQKGGERKGNKAASVMGVEGVNNEKPSGVNLDKLGLGVGKVISKSGAGAISTNFQNSAGGAGGGMGSGAKTYGFGGAGGGKSLGVPGAGAAAGNWGSGSGGLLGGQGGSGGLGGTGTGPGFGGGAGGHGRANVEVPAGDPVVSGGLTPQEIQAVIRANLNQIRHCYEQLLQRSPSASGKIGVKFVVGISGRVDAANISDSTISDAVMQGCVTGKIKRWAFPSPRGGQPVTVSYPFVFNPS